MPIAVSCSLNPKDLIVIGLLFFQAIFIALAVIQYSSAAGNEGSRCTSDYHCANSLACKNRRCQNPCDDKACVPNTDCTATNHRAICACKKGFSGHPSTGCTRIESCTYNPDCDLNMSCRYGKCVDPCPTECQNKHKCQVISHVPICDD
ncbi:hypothetical protein Bhyg_05979 [Pseudolycoriella hygida]|uniref:EGF-like domain-containing protein n=1 Tax=Pseudolycoriella hygida TaxID=35572 RepID=A0A9Q0N1B9_9DIPT|nr:hypothetical protein Bhyg_05979 [Pseudolycoriella hygida]